MILSGDEQWGGKQEKLTILFSLLCKFFHNFAPILYKRLTTNHKRTFSQ